MSILDGRGAKSLELADKGATMKMTTTMTKKNRIGKRIGGYIVRETGQHRKLLFSVRSNGLD